MVNITAGGQAISSHKELRAFLEGQGAETRLRGSKDAQGNITLYTSDKRAGFFDRITGRAADRIYPRGRVRRWASSMVSRGATKACAAC